MKKWILYTVAFAIAAGILVAAYVWFFVYNKPHKDIENTKPDFTVTAESLIQEFETNDTAASRKYDEKVIQFSGNFNKIESADTTVSVVFDFGGKNIISAQVLPKYKNEVQALNPGTPITLKGLYNGYITGDPSFDLPGNILLNKCSPVK